MSAERQPDSSTSQDNPLPALWQYGAMTVWAARHGWPLLDAPLPETLLAQDERWIGDRFDGSMPWVFPRLERTYLRHVHGLGTIRRLLDDMCAGRLGRGIVGCDSWAWAYLMDLWRGRHLTVMAAQAFDPERLGRWFDELSSGTGGRRLDFRQSTDGKYVLPPIAGAEKDDAQYPKMSTFLRYLAAYSRRIPGVALAFWRKSLRRFPDPKKSNRT